MIGKIEVKNPRHRHPGIKVLRFMAFAMIAVVPIPPMMVLGVYVKYARDLPELQPIESYYQELQTPTTFHAADGLVIGEFFEERRLFLPLDEMPIHLIQAFLAAEDERFFQHDGVDTRSILRAAVANLTAGQIVQGASTLTQQMAKALVGDERSYTRKIREAILARRMEDLYSKSEILTLYLNKIFLGHNSYGVQAAAQNYFRKNVHELSLGEMCALAVLPPSPSTVNPIRNLPKTLERREHVLNRMVQLEFVSAKQADAARKEPVVAYPLLDEFGERMPMVAAQARENLTELLGESDDLEAWRKGYRVHTTVELDLQHVANAALRVELDALDRKQGYRGPVGVVEVGEIEGVVERAVQYYLSHGLLADGEPIEGETYLAFVTEVSDERLEATVLPEVAAEFSLEELRWAGEYNEFPLVTYEVVKHKGRTLVTKLDAEGAKAYENREVAPAPEDDRHEDERDEELTRRELENTERRYTIQKRDETAKVSWNRKLKSLNKTFGAGDVLLVRKTAEGFELTQKPGMQGAVLSWDPYSGYTRAMVGGADFDDSEVNRVFSVRQTGSTMKPVFYALAYDLGHRPSYPHSDAPFRRGGFKSSGGSSDSKPMLAYQGLVKSRNTVSLRVSRWVFNKFRGEEARKEAFERWQKQLNLLLPMAYGETDYAYILGGDQTVWNMSEAFSRFLTGGLEPRRSVVRKVVDKSGRILLDNTWFGDASIGPREAISAMYGDVYQRKPRQLRESTAFLMRHNLRGVVRAGTATKARKLKHAAAGKTGSLPYDVWFNGFNSHAVTTVWVGADRRERILGRSKAKSGVYGAGPPLKVFLKVADRAAGERPKRDFLKPIPGSIEFVSVDPGTGNRTMDGGGVRLPHRSAFVPLIVEKGEGSTDDLHHSETDF